MKIHRLESIASTNKYCESLHLDQVEDFTCFWAIEQTDGIGQQGNYWHSERGKNLTFSLVLHPCFLPAARQFMLTQTLSLAIVDFLLSLNIDSPIHIKWPNDIYVDQKKICGILTSAHICNGTIGSAICGIGLNINQTAFPSWIPNPTSLSLLKYPMDIEVALNKLLSCINIRYTQLQQGWQPQADYLAHLMQLNTPSQYLYKGQLIEATITGVDEYGHLLLSTPDNRNLCCQMKEISFLLDKTSKSTHQINHKDNTPNPIL